MTRRMHTRLFKDRLLVSCFRLPWVEGPLRAPPHCRPYGPELAQKGGKSPFARFRAQALVSWPGAVEW